MRLDLDRALSVREAALLFAVILAGAILPILVVQVPPLHDYPEHIARSTILAQLAGSPTLQVFYEPGSLLIPNVGVDVLVPFLARFMPIEVAGRLFLCLELALQLSGVAFLHAALHRRLSAWPLLAGGLLLYNWIFLFCLLNYLLGLGLLLWGLGAWLLLRERSLAQLVAGGSLIALLLFFAHLVAFGLFALLVAGWELRAAWGRWRDERRAALMGLLAAGLPFALPALLFVSFSPIAQELERRIVYQPFWSWKPGIFVRALAAGHPAFDVAYAVVAAICLLLVLRSGRLSLASGAWLLLAISFGVFLALPATLMEAYYVDARIPVALGMLAAAATRLRFDLPRWNALVALLLAALLLARTLVFTQDWVRHDAKLGAIVDSFVELPDGSVLFLAEVFPTGERPTSGLRMLDPGPRYARWRPPLKHVGSLAVLEKPVFVPATWASPTQQPLSVTSAYRDLYDLQRRGPFELVSPQALSGVIQRIRALYARAAQARPAPYLLLVGGGGALKPRSDDADVVAEGDGFVLVRLKMRPSSGG